MRYKCEICEKTLETNDEYNKETEDVGNGWEWTVEHKEEFCGVV